MTNSYPRFSSIWTFLLLHHPIALATQKPIVPETKHLNVTVTAGANGTSILECWQLAAPFFTSTQPGTAGSMVLQLGNLEKASYSIIPAGMNDGYHTAPAPQYVVILSGSAMATVPERGQEAVISAGKNSVLIAVDTPDVSELGHVTEFLEETILLQIPFAGGMVPEHTVLYQDACSCDELLE